MGKKTVLVIEDDANIRMALFCILNQDGFKVLQAEDGIDGLKLATKKKPDLILLDWMMPEMNGIDVLRRLRRRDAIKDIPVIMLTAKGAISDVERGFAAGADGYITKPFDVAKISDCIKKKLETMAGK